MYPRRSLSHRRTPSRRGSGPLLALSGCVALALLSACSPRQVRIVLITLDTLRYDSLAGSAQWPSTMPHLVRWAEEATLFERFFSATASTQPSHASMFTGLHPWQHGVSRNGLRLADEHQTVAETLRAAGFSTAAVVASFPLSRRFGFARGFDRFDDDFDAGKLSPGEWLRASRRVAVEGSQPEAQLDDPFYSLADRVTERALGEIAAATGQRQFFWFHYFDPHSPYGDTGDGATTRPAEALRLARAGEDPAPAVRRARLLYDADVAFLDRALGRLLEGLEQGAAAYETHILLVSDHGESFGEEGSMAHGRRLIPSQIHVPCIIRSSRLDAGVRQDVAGSVDIAATLLSLAGLETATGAARDLTASVPHRSRAVGMRRTYEEPFHDVRLDGSVHILDDHQFFLVAEDGGIYRGNSARVDPPTLPPAGLADDQARQLRAVFDGFEQELTASKAEKIEDPEVEEKLRALGYVG